jgi:hypothetical protein
MVTVAEDRDVLTIELDCVTGRLTLAPGSVPPAEVEWTDEVLETIRRGGTLWCSIKDDVIEMRILPETLWYRLTGDRDPLTGCALAVRCNADGSDHGKPE